MGPDDAIDALSSDFTCSSPTGKQTEKEVLFSVLLSRTLLENNLGCKNIILVLFITIELPSPVNIFCIFFFRNQQGTFSKLSLLE